MKEYLPITGLADFNKLSAKLIFGSERLENYRVCSFLYLVLIIFPNELCLVQVSYLACRTETHQLDIYKYEHIFGSLFMKIIS